MTEPQVPPLLLPLESIRSIAARYGYTEIQFNEESRVIGFKSMNGQTRINVYYTTGTVATCLSHPLKGKTQLFRRNQNLANLETLFQNPRQHTGQGYYYNTMPKKTAAGDRDGNHRLRWVSLSSSGRRSEKAICDDAQRWRYVQSVVGTSFCTIQQVNQIAAICELWNTIRYDPNGPSTMELYNSFDDEKKSRLYSPCPQGCGNCGQDRAGTFCALGSILLDVARITEESASNGVMTIWIQMFPSIDFILPILLPLHGKRNNQFLLTVFVTVNASKENKSNNH